MKQKIELASKQVAFVFFNFPLKFRWYSISLVIFIVLFYSLWFEENIFNEETKKERNWNQVR